MSQTIKTKPLESPQPLSAYIKRMYGTQRAYAEAIGKHPAEVSRRIRRRYWMIGGVLYGPVKREAK